MKLMEMSKKLVQVLFVPGLFMLVVCDAAWGSGGEGGHGGVHNAWGSSDTYKLMSFTLLAIGAIYVIKKMAVPFFSSRIKDIESEIKELEQKKADAQKTLAEYQAKFKNLDQESKQIVSDYIKQGEAAKERIIAEAEAQAEKLEDLAKRNIEQEFKAAKADLQQEVAQKAMQKAEEVIKAAISSEDQDKLVDEYLKKVVA